MKQSDIFSIIFVAGVGVLASFFACRAIMGDPSDAKTEFKRLNAVISRNYVEPNAEVFNSQAINPTVEVYVGDCEDIDKNGILDESELIACKRIEAPVETEEEENGSGDEGEENTAGESVDGSITGE